MLSRLMPGMVIASLVVIGVLVALVIVLSSSNWPSTEGVIVASSYKKNSYTNTSSPVVEGGRIFDYDIILEYEYVVNGVKYTGNKLYASLPDNPTGERFANQFQSI